MVLSADAGTCGEIASAHVVARNPNLKNSDCFAIRRTSWKIRINKMIIMIKRTLIDMCDSVLLTEQLYKHVQNY